MTASAGAVSFVGVLVRRCPFLLPLLDEHLANMDGEVLPHLFAADVERWAEEAWDEGDHRQLELLMAAIEDEYGRGSDDVQNVIVVSFLEHLPPPGDERAGLRERWSDQRAPSSSPGSRDR